MASHRLDDPEGGKKSLFPTGRLAWAGMAALGTAVALFSFRYTFGKGPVPANVATNRHVDPWIVIHATSAATALLLGPAQFVPTLRKRLPVLHRAIGRLYVAGCAIGGVSALVLSSGISAGRIAQFGFALGGVTWLITTGTALDRIFAGDVSEHRRWMIRSYALTFAAVTLRLYLPLSQLLGFGFAPSYSAIAWLCWLPNLLVAEWSLRRHPSARSDGAVLLDLV